MPSALQHELLAATDLQVRKSEERNEFFHRLIDAVQDISNEAWDSLSTDAQKWVNAGARLIKKDGEDAEIPEFADFKPDKTERVRTKPQKEPEPEPEQEPVEEEPEA